MAKKVIFTEKQIKMFSLMELVSNIILETDEKKGRNKNDIYFNLHTY